MSKWILEPINSGIAEDALQNWSGEEEGRRSSMQFKVICWRGWLGFAIERKQGRSIAIAIQLRWKQEREVADARIQSSGRIQEVGEFIKRAKRGRHQAVPEID